MDARVLPWERPNDRSLADRIAAGAARSIVEGEVEPGALLTEADLTAVSGASRTPVREAMLRLQAWGLVRLAPKKGGVVTVVSDAQRRDLLEIRSGWEIRAVELIATDVDERAALAETLREIVTEQQAALEANDALRFASLDFAFHLRVIEAAGNAVVAELMETLGPRLARLTFQAVAGDLEAAAVFRDEHEALVGWIADGDAGGFVSAIRAHVWAGHFRHAAQ